MRDITVGILLAGEIIERITGQRLRDFVRERIFLPLGMTRTALGLGPGVTIEDCVCAYI